MSVASGIFHIFEAKYDRMEYLVLILVMGSIAGLIFLIYFWFLKKRYPAKTEQMLNSVIELEEFGLKKNENGFSGNYRNYLINIYATTSLPSFDANYFNSGGDRYQVWIATAPEPGQLKGLGGFFGKYMITGETTGFAYIGFLINAKITPDAKKTIMERINTLITLLEEKKVRPYVVSNV